MLLSLHPNVIVHVENVVSLFSSPSTTSQKVRKCGSHNFVYVCDLCKIKCVCMYNNYLLPWVLELLAALTISVYCEDLMNLGYISFCINWYICSCRNDSLCDRVCCCCCCVSRPGLQ